MDKHIIMKKRIKQSLLLAIIISLSSCETQINFTIHWNEIFSALGYILLGAAIVFIFLLIFFGNSKFY